MEKFLGFFDLTENIGKLKFFKNGGRSNTREKYRGFWKGSLEVPPSRLLFYSSLKCEPGFEEYLNVENFHNRRSIAKIRLSDHHLGIEKGRHNDVSRVERICKMYPLKAGRRRETLHHTVHLLCSVQIKL